MRKAEGDDNAKCFFGYFQPLARTACHHGMVSHQPQCDARRRSKAPTTTVTPYPTARGLESDGNRHFDAGSESESNLPTTNVNLSPETNSKNSWDVSISADGMSNFRDKLHPRTKGATLAGVSPKGTSNNAPGHLTERLFSNTSRDHDDHLLKESPVDENEFENKRVIDSSTLSYKSARETIKATKSEARVGGQATIEDSTVPNFSSVSKPNINKHRDRQGKINHSPFDPNNQNYIMALKDCFKNETTDAKNNGNDSYKGCLDDSCVEFRVSEEETNQLTQTSSGITVTLLNSSLWRAFHEIGTEMIINRGGRRMFPYLALSVQGLDPDGQYDVSIHVVPATTRRFKYINLKWIPVGLADTETVQMPIPHQDSPNQGQYWNNSKITFSKVKLTNNLESASSTDRPSKKGVTKSAVSFTFPETDFMAVTAYQNEAVTQMKIHNNPFAKAFRDANFSSHRRNVASRKRKYSIRHQGPGQANGAHVSGPSASSSVVCTEKPDRCDLVTSLASGPHLPPPCHLNAFYGLGEAAVGLGLGLPHGLPHGLPQTSSLLGLGNIGYCLPWRGISIIPAPLCSRLLPLAGRHFAPDSPMDGHDKTFPRQASTSIRSRPDLEYPLSSPSSQ